MPAIDVIPITHGGGAVEQRQASSSSGGGAPRPTHLNSAGFNGYGWTPVPVTPKTRENGSMEHRLNTLDTDMKDVRERLVRVETKLDGMQQKVDGLPSKDFVTAAVSGSANKLIVWVVVALGASQLIPSVVLPVLKHFGVSQ